MQKKSEELYCFVPGLINAYRQLQDQGSSKFDSIEHFFAKADTQSHQREYLQSLAEIIGVKTSGNQDLPTAAIQANIILSETNTAAWLEAHPVNLLPDRDKLYLKTVDPEFQDNLNADAICEMANQMVNHFNVDFRQVLITPQGNWLLELDSPCSVKTHFWQEVVGQHIQEFLPEGKDAIKWHSVMNEMQMFLHMQNAEQYGFNALWLDGAGSVSSMPEVIGCEFYSDDFLTRSIASYAGKTMYESFESFLQASETSDKLIYTDTGLLVDYLTQQSSALNSRLEKLNRLLAKAITRLKKRQLKQITLYGFSGKSYHLKLNDLYRFWRNKKA
jgi:hypothetical protein